MFLAIASFREANEMHGGTDTYDVVPMRLFDTLGDAWAWVDAQPRAVWFEVIEFIDGRRVDGSVLRDGLRAALDDGGLFGGIQGN